MIAFPYLILMGYWYLTATAIKLSKSIFVGAGYADDTGI